MRSRFERRRFCALVAFVAAVLFLMAPAVTFAQGGEPQYFAIRGARIVPVSGPPIAEGTIVIARGVIVSVAKDATRAWQERAHIGDLEALRHRGRVTEAGALIDPTGLGAFRVLEWEVGK